MKLIKLASSVLLAGGATVALSSSAVAQTSTSTSANAAAEQSRDHTYASPDARAEQTLRQMTLDEKLTMLRGYIPFTMTPRPNVTLGAGYVPGVPRLGIPPLVESDAGLGISNMGAVMRGKDTATAFPSATAMASTWDPDLIERTGIALGAETRGKGFNVQLAGSINLVREPRNGRNFEYMSEDPLLSGVLGGRVIRGIQSNNVISTIKHYALNAQETGRTTLSAKMDEAAMRESDLLAFEIAMEIGDPGSVMCAYNRVNGVYACENSFLLNDVLRRDWGFKGWVMSDWGAVHSTSIKEGLDQESGTRPAEKAWFGEKLRAQIDAGTIGVADVDRSVRRILRTLYAFNVTSAPVANEAGIDYAAHGQAALTVAENGIVLLKNSGVLPIAPSAKRVLLVGGHADVGTLQGGGSSQVSPVGGPSLILPIPGEPLYHRRLYSPSAPLKHLAALLPGAAITYDDGSDPQRAATAAHQADLVVVFAEQFTAEGSDVPSLNLPDNQDRLIEAVAAANPRTAVVLETGGPVAMPWVDKVAAVVAAWYPGQRGGEAIARILSGAANPSGRLPVTFPRSLDQTPNPKLPGATLVKGQSGEDLYDVPKEQRAFEVSYPEGADVGYRWYDRQKTRPLFTFGHGLSYTTFSYADLTVKGGAGITASFRIANTGKRAGTETAQLYVTVGGVRRLAGWSRVSLQPGEQKQVEIKAEPRIIANFDVKARGWRIAPGDYTLEVSAAADAPRLTGMTRLKARSLKP